MITSPYAVLAADAGVLAVFGSPPRCYPFGEAPQPPALPYATWQLVSGAPENYLDERPNLSSQRLQFDVYARTGIDCDAAADAIDTALESHGHWVSLNLSEREPETALHRISFDFEFWQSR